MEKEDPAKGRGGVRFAVWDPAKVTAKDILDWAKAQGPPPDPEAAEKTGVTSSSDKPDGPHGSEPEG